MRTEVAMKYHPFSGYLALFTTAIALTIIAPLAADEPAPVVREISDTSLFKLEAGGPEACPSCECTRSACCCGRFVDWKTVPDSIRPMARPGNFPIPRTGCGYY